MNVLNIVWLETKTKFRVEKKKWETFVKTSKYLSKVEANSNANN